MKYTANGPTAGHRGRGGVRARLVDGFRERLRTRLEDGERGSILIECVVFMGVIGITLAAYTGANMTMNGVQRTQTATDIVAQQAHGVLEAAKSADWGRLGFNRTQQSNVPASPVGGYWTVLHGQPASDEDDLAPHKTLTRSGVTMTQVTDIVWVRCDGSVCTATTQPDAYGTKRVSVTITYTVGQDTRTRTARYTLLRSSTPSESTPPTTTLPPSVDIEGDPL